MKPKTTTAFALPLCALALSGCVVPEDFEVNIKALENRMELTYEGELVAPMIEAEAKKGADTADVQELVASLIDSLKKDVLKLDGEADVQIEPEQGGWMSAELESRIEYPQTAGSERTVLNFLYMVRKDSSVQFFSKYLKTSDRTQLKALGLEGEGTFCIETELPVKAHNADSEPGLFSDAYCWDLQLLEGDSVKFEVAVR